MASLIPTDGIRTAPAAPTSTALVLPRVLTPLIAEGAIMEPLFVNQEWPRFQLHGPCSGIALPSKEDARASLWMEQSVMDGAREFLSYECHDLRIVKVDQSGQLNLLICKRVEPAPSSDGSETAPINGFWWSIGGRREIPKTNSPLDGKFSLIDSVLNKARREAGIQPQSVLGVYDLGIGRTEFTSRMRYVSLAMDSEGKPLESARDVQLVNPQRTINRNLVILVDTDVTVADQSVEHLTFISAGQYSDPQTRAQFCEYERTFIDAVFEGWNATKLQGRSLNGTFN